MRSQFICGCVRRHTAHQQILPEPLSNHLITRLILTIAHSNNRISKIPARFDSLIVNRPISNQLVFTSFRNHGTHQRTKNGICNAEPIVDSLVKDKSNGASAFSH